MKLIKIALLTCLSFNVWAQNSIKHTVQKGETLNGLANKYKVKSDDIIKLNPSLKDGLKADAVIEIPKAGNTKDNKQVSQKTHTVLAGETLSSIAKQYKVSVAEIVGLNPDSKTVLKEDVKLILPSNAKTTSVSTSEKVKISLPTKHLIVDGDTKYNISKKYNLSIEELEKLNPHIKDAFEIGTEVRLQKGIELNMTRPVATIISSEKITSHTVAQGETLFAISQKYKVEVSDIEAANPELKDGLKEGLVILIPNKKKVFVETPKKDLSKSINNQNTKRLTLFLPFNFDKIENDPNKSKAEYLKSDKFLNITLDFYEGALAAIDSAKAMGLPVKYRILDVYTSKSTTNIAEVINSNSFENDEVVIGPFSNDVVVQGGKLLEDKNVSIISPLSKEYAQGGKNVYFSMPTENLQRLKLLSYLESKSPNISVIIDQNKSEERQFVVKNSPSAKFVSFKDNDNINIESLKSIMQKNQKNFILVETERPALMMQIISVMLKLRKEYDLQLAVFERNEAVEYDEIHSKNLTTFKMLYPSVINDNESQAAIKFMNSFKKDNKVFPNQYAIRGFDVTFDTILRMFQDGGFQSTLESKTEQLESAYKYIENHNQEVFIMQYDDNLTIKKVE